MIRGGKSLRPKKSSKHKRGSELVSSILRAGHCNGVARGGPSSLSKSDLDCEPSCRGKHQYPQSVAPHEIIMPKVNNSLP